ncbi:unnamed protein product [Closterium sp. NIES-65]|nr:unnamed protein product [Closterium sp. NIES-65]
MGMGVGDDGHGGGMDRDAWLQERAHGPGKDRGTRRDAGVFRSPKERERHRDERGRCRGFGERPRERGGGMGGDDQVGILQENATQDVAAERGVEEDEEHPGLQVKEADEGNDGDDQAVGTGEAELAQADESAGASQAAAEELRAAPQEARTETSARLHGKGKAERSRTPEKDPHHGEWRVGDFRPYGRRQE